MHKKFITTGALLGAIAVALGAFGAHGLKKIVPAETVQTFQTGVQYQMYHALALLLTGLLYEKCSQKFAGIAGVLFIIGVILFSGSLYFSSLRFIKAFCNLSNSSGVFINSEKDFSFRNNAMISVWPLRAAHIKGV